MFMMDEELRHLEEIHERVVAEGSITDKVQCPRCESVEVSWVGGDMSGLGDYYHMYVCEDCGRLPKGVQVFLVPCSEEDYGHDPLALPRDPNAVTSMAMQETDFGFKEGS